MVCPVRLPLALAGAVLAGPRPLFLSVWGGSDTGRWGPWLSWGYIRTDGGNGATGEFFSTSCGAGLGQ